MDIPVPHGRDRVGGGLLGLPLGQSSTAFGGARSFPAATAEQIVDTPVPRGGRVLHPASSSSGLPGTANQWVFRTFPRGKKCDVGSALGVGTGVRTSAHPRRRLSWRISSRMQLVCGCSFQVVGGNFCSRTQKSGGLGEGWDGVHVMRQPTTTFGRISSCSPVFVLAQFALGIWYIISFVFASGSHCSGRLGIAEEYGTTQVSARA